MDLNILLTDPTFLIVMLTVLVIGTAIGASVFGRHRSGFPVFMIVLLAIGFFVFNYVGASGTSSVGDSGIVAVTPSYGQIQCEQKDCSECRAIDIVNVGMQNFTNKCQQDDVYFACKGQLETLVADTKNCIEFANKRTDELGACVAQTNNVSATLNATQSTLTTCQNRRCNNNDWYLIAGIVFAFFAAALLVTNYLSNRHYQEKLMQKEKSLAVKERNIMLHQHTDSGLPTTDLNVDGCTDVKQN